MVEMTTAEISRQARDKNSKFQHYELSPRMRNNP